MHVLVRKAPSLSLCCSNLTRTCQREINASSMNFQKERNIFPISKVQFEHFRKYVVQSQVPSNTGAQ